MIANWSEMSSTLLQWVVETNIWCGTIAMGALALDHLLRKRVKAKWRLMLYLPAILRLFGSYSFESEAPMLTLSEASHGLASIASRATSTSAGSFLLNLWPAIYAIGFLLLLLWRRHSMRRLREALSTAYNERVILTDLETWVHKSLGPMVVGIMKPKLVLSEDLLASLSKGELNWVILHEQEHIRARDLWLLATLQLATIATWPIVASWIVLRRLTSLIEQSCDERVLRGRTGQERQSYAATLLRVKDLSMERAVFPLPVLSMGSVLVERVHNLEVGQRWGRWAQPLVVVGCAFCLGVLGGVAQSSAGTLPEGHADLVQTALSTLATNELSRSSIEMGYRGYLTVGRAETLNLITQFADGVGATSKQDPDRPWLDPTMKKKEGTIEFEIISSQPLLHASVPEGVDILSEGALLEGSASSTTDIALLVEALTRECSDGAVSLQSVVRAGEGFDFQVLLGLRTDSKAEPERAD